MKVKKPLLVCASFLAVCASAQTNAVKVRSLALRECVDLALKFNLDAQIARHSPTIAKYRMKAAVGAHYDPVFSFEVSRNYWDVPGNFDPKKGTPDNPYQETLDTIEMGIEGKLTPGLSYGIVNSTTDDQGFSPFSTYRTDLPDRSTNMYEGLLEFKLSQSLLKDFWTDSGRTAIDVSKKDMKISEQSLRMELMNVVFKVYVAYYDLCYANENVKVMTKAESLAKELWEQDKARVTAGKLPPLSEKLAESQFETAVSARLAAEDVLKTKRIALLTLLTDDLVKEIDTEIHPAEALLAMPIKVSRTESFQTAMNMRPDLQDAKLQVEKQGIIVRYTHNQTFPQLDLTGSFGSLAVQHGRTDAYSSLGAFDHSIYGAGVVLKVPLSNTAARNKYKASLEVKEQSLLNLKKVEQNIFAEVDDVVKSMDTLYKRVASAKLAREYAEVALEAEQKKYSTGVSTSFMVNQYERNLVQAHTSEISAIADYNKAQAKLAYSEGSLLDKASVKMDVK